MQTKPSIFARRHRSISRWISVAALRQSLIYRPIAALLILLMLPVIEPLMPQARDSGGGLQDLPGQVEESGSLFQAKAQGTVFCFPGNPAAIIRKFCGVDGAAVVPELVTLEAEAVSAYLAMHRIPQSEANFIYQYGRKDLRNQVRAIMFARLMEISRKPASARSAYERALYLWLQRLVQRDEINLYLETLNHFNYFRSNPCGFVLNKDVKDTLGITYENSVACTNNNSFHGGASVPSADYFRMVGFVNSYGKINDEYPTASQIAADTQLNLPMIVGIGTAATSIIVTGVTASLYSLMTWIAAGSYVGYLAKNLAANGLTYSVFAVVNQQTVNAVGAGTLSLGPAIIIGIAVAGGIAAGVQSVTAQQQIDSLSNLQSSLDKARRELPDLGAMAQDSTGLGMYKMNLSFISATLPDVESTTVIPEYRPNVDSLLKSEDTRGQFRLFDKIRYFDWDETHWDLSTYGDWFVQKCVQGSRGEFCSTLKKGHSITGTIRFLNSRFERSLASRMGNRFVITKANPAATDKPCPADQTTGVSPGTDFSKCSSYVADKFEMMLVPLSGVRTFGTVSISPFKRPTFSGNGLFNISVGVPASFQITATGDPAPEVCPDLVAGLPAPLKVSGCNKSTVTLSYDGTGSPRLGMFPFTLSAKNTVATIVQGFAVNIASEPVKIITPNSFTAQYRQYVDFTLVATGNPKPRFTLDPGVDLQGLSFRDNLDGTATISGLTGEATILGPCTGDCPRIRASNGLTSDSQIFTVQIDSPPQAGHAGPFEYTVPAGLETELPIQPTGGTTTPVTWRVDASSAQPPSWMQFVSGTDGVGRLTLNPPKGTSGSFPLDLVVTAEGTRISFRQRYTINVNNGPQFTSPNRLSFTVTGPALPGELEKLALVTATAGTVDTTSTLPPGIEGTRDAANSRYLLRARPGNPPVGSGGVYHMQFKAETLQGTATQDVAVQVFERPTIIGDPLAVMFAGRPGEFTVGTWGYPVVGTLVGVPSTAPTNPNDGLGMFFTTQGLPASLQASNLNFAGFPTGTLRISGTPASTEVGTHRVQVTAANGVGTPAQRTVTLVVYPYAPTTSVNLLTNSAITRSTENTFVATVVVSNNGRDAAQRVVLNTVRLNGVAGSVLPASVASIAPASSATFTVRFPSNVVPSTTNLLSITGSHAGGSFNSTARVALP